MPISFSAKPTSKPTFDTGALVISWLCVLSMLSRRPSVPTEADVNECLAIIVHPALEKNIAVTVDLTCMPVYK